MYRPMLWFFLIGALLPAVFYCLDRRFPKMKLRKVRLLQHPIHKVYRVETNHVRCLF